MAGTVMPELTTLTFGDNTLSTVGYGFLTNATMPALTSLDFPHGLATPDDYFMTPMNLSGLESISFPLDAFQTIPTNFMTDITNGAMTNLTGPDITATISGGWPVIFPHLSIGSGNNGTGGTGGNGTGGTGGNSGGSGNQYSGVDLNRIVTPHAPTNRASTQIGDIFVVNNYYITTGGMPDSFSLFGDRNLPHIDTGMVSNVPVYFKVFHSRSTGAIDYFTGRVN